MNSYLFLALILSAVVLPSSAAAGNAAFSDNFEHDLSRWAGLWTRDENAGRSDLDASVSRRGRASLRIRHAGENDWSFSPKEPFPVRPGQICELQAELLVQGPGRAAVCGILRDEKGRVMDYAFGERSLRETDGWRRVSSRFVIPPGAATILPRLIGYGPATVHADEFSFRMSGRMPVMEPAVVTVKNQWLEASVESPSGILRVRDLRSGRTWEQKALNPDVFVSDLKCSLRKREIRMKLVQAGSARSLRAVLALERHAPELALELSGNLDMPGALRYPHPFASRSGERLILPVNEGISFPADDDTVEEQWYHTYGGHGLCMGFYGSVEGGTGWMAIVETNDDAGIHVGRMDGRLVIAPEWHSCKGRLGYPRRLRYIFLSQGGYVAMAKRYRKHAEEAGLVKTLKQKMAENPNVDLLIGAVNVWTWEKNALEIAREMKSLGIDRILWSHREDPETIRAMNEMGGILTSRYDIYQDLMDPACLGRIGWAHPDWTQDAWPRDLMLGADGKPLSGWAVKDKDGAMIPCGVLCDKPAPDYARIRISTELKTHPYHSRFIDTTTAAPWRECYHPKHPLDRRGSRKAKMELLDLVSGEMGLICGSETGHDAAVPYVHYFEGMLSLGPYRVPDSGRNMRKLWDEIPERVAKYQLGEKYRLPLWELVYHDCVVSTWYWGDYNNKLPKLWDKRDLFNILYGTPPMFMFDREVWEKYKDRFVRSYRDVCPVARRVGMAEMTNHRALSPDQSVQMTRFSNDVTVIVNFGAAEYELPGGETLPAGSFMVRHHSQAM